MTISKKKKKILAHSLHLIANTSISDINLFFPIKSLVIPKLS
jgi:hypothetical protein